MDSPRPQYAIIQALHEAVLDPERRDKTVEVDGTGLRLQYDPEPGVDMRIEAVEAPDATRNTIFRATDERPASYPPELPFLPGIAASVMGQGGSASASWWGVPDADGAVAALRAQSAADGWTERAEALLDFIPGLPGIRTLTLQRGDGGERTIQITAVCDKTMISLISSAG